MGTSLAFVRFLGSQQVVVAAGLRPETVVSRTGQRPCTVSIGRLSGGGVHRRVPGCIPGVSSASHGLFTPSPPETTEARMP